MFTVANLGRVCDMLVSDGLMHDGQIKDVMVRYSIQEKRILIDRRNHLRKSMGKRRISYEVGEMEIIERRHSDPLGQFSLGEIDAVTVGSDGSITAGVDHVGGVLSGSFDPLHEGHEGLAKAASGMLDAEVVFELAVANVDKKSLDEQVIRERLAQFVGRNTVIVTREPRFDGKAALLPGCTFVIGWDTAARLFVPRYYGDDEGHMLAAMSKVRDLGCSFLVAGRVVGGEFRSLDGLEIPAGFSDMLIPIPESVFRQDLSSTELRLASGENRERNMSC